MNQDLFAMIVEKYAQLNTILDDFMVVCNLEASPERDALLDSIKDRTNHTGIHYTTTELTRIFLGSRPITWML